VEAEGPVESFTVTYARDGTPSRAIASHLRADGNRALSGSEEPEAIQALLAGEAAGSAQAS
jgi:hypothetical protein